MPDDKQVRRFKKEVHKQYVSGFYLTSGTRSALSVGLRKIWFDTLCSFSYTPSRKKRAFADVFALHVSGKAKATSFKAVTT